MKLLPDAIWLATEPVDMRTGVDGLSLDLQQALGRAPCSGTAYVFSNRRHTRLKAVSWDGIGVWMYLCQLHRGQCTWPHAVDVSWWLNGEQWHWQWLVIGVNWQRLSAPALALCLNFSDESIVAFRDVIELQPQRLAKFTATSNETAAHSNDSDADLSGVALHASV